jgi:secondary thiamine-phosphate synthase enzyme
MRQFHKTLKLDTGEDISIADLTPAITEAIEVSGIHAGIAIISSRHTTTALAINEFEPRLLEDIKQWLQRLAPPRQGYMHDDIHLRDCPPDEPQNAHSHLAALLMGSSETVPVVDGRLAIGQWQSVLLFDLDGPRQRTVNIQIIGE